MTAKLQLQVGVRDEAWQKQGFLPPKGVVTFSIVCVVILVCVTSMKPMVLNRNVFLSGYSSSCDLQQLRTAGNNTILGAENIVCVQSGGGTQPELVVTKSKTIQAKTREGMAKSVKLMMNCTGFNLTSELFEKIPKNFLPQLKNPCWYEPLEKYDVYVENKYLQGMFRDMTRVWKDRIEHQAARRLRCLPYFFIAGQPKCGSTDLYRKLTSHPDVVTPPMKEPHWWARNRFDLPRSESVPFTHYIDIFDKAALEIEKASNSTGEPVNNQRITVDGSVSTLWDRDHWPHFGEQCGYSEPKFTMADLIRYLLPKSRIIVILRDPTERMYSDYLYFQKQKKSADDFHIAAVSAIQAFQKCLKNSSVRSCVYNKTIEKFSRVRLRVGIYYVYLQEWLQKFPKRQIFVLRLEDYSKKRDATLKSIFKFLGLRPLSPSEYNLTTNKPANSRSAKDKELGSMRQDTRELLNKFYYEYNHKLATLLSDTKYLWT